MVHIHVGVQVHMIERRVLWCIPQLIDFWINDGDGEVKKGLHG